MSKFIDDILAVIIDIFRQFPERNAFCIDGNFYTYKQLERSVAMIQHRINGLAPSNVGLVINDDLETYASILALWFKGDCYVPLHPNWPIERCSDICAQVGVDVILDSSDKSRYESNSVLPTKDLVFGGECIELCEDATDNSLAYILFTSGSTGKPKGVPIKRLNVAAFVKSFWDVGFTITEQDRILQCFDLSFDLSVMSYLIPLLKGACIYTVPYDAVKYMYISGLLDDYHLTVSLMTPSTINCLRPYFDEIYAPELRYSLFCGEALREDVVQLWAKCVPNADIYNVYGPTEDTIFCTTYKYKREEQNKTHNGVLSIGTSMTSGEVIVLNEECDEMPDGQIGELCLYGEQLFDGYWNNDDKTKESFIIAKNGKKYYKSGDLCYKDNGDVMFSGRIDHQAKIQGFRVELGEIECHARAFMNNEKNVVCITNQNEIGLTEIVLVVESEPFDANAMIAYMKSKMPQYMIPKDTLFERNFPLNANGKIDIKCLKAKLNL